MITDILFTGILYSGEFILETLFDQHSILKNIKFIKNENSLIPKKINFIVVRETADIAAFIVHKNQMENNLYNFLNTSIEIIQLKQSYALISNFYKMLVENKNNYFIISYDELINNPQYIMNNIHSILGIEHFSYDTTFLKYILQLDSKKILSEFYDEYDQTTFWNLKYESAKPIKDIQLQLDYALNGDFENAKMLVDKLEREQPMNHRAAFNRGWFKMKEGKLLEGHRLLDRGRLINVFGNNPNLPLPIWNGKKSGTVLFYLEGGLGDQIHFFRYANVIKKMNNDVIVACDAGLVELFTNNTTCKVISHDQISYFYNVDCWVPSMSVISILQYEYENISNEPYIDFEKKSIDSNKITIGLKWSGNPKFEHQQHRKFPLDLFFENVYNTNYNYISLQRDEESDMCPSWVEKQNLNTWMDTKNAIEKCDLIISSCTSVPHLSSAMGVETWILVPILPYFLWALPSEKTPYYKNTTLFRQTNKSNWHEPMEKIKFKLNEFDNYIKNT